MLGIEAIPVNDVRARVQVVRCAERSRSGAFSTRNGHAVIDLDDIGQCSELKLEILQKYAQAYSKILASQRPEILRHVYIDAFAGSGLHISRTTGEMVRGSPTNALAITPPFSEYHLIDLNSDRVSELRRITK